jgi:hypothetical protein
MGYVHLKSYHNWNTNSFLFSHTAKAQLWIPRFRFDLDLIASLNPDPGRQNGPQARKNLIGELDDIFSLSI